MMGVIKLAKKDNSFGVRNQPFGFTSKTSKIMELTNNNGFEFFGVTN